MRLIFEWLNWYERQRFLENIPGKTHEIQYQQASGRILNKITKDVIEG